LVPEKPNDLNDSRSSKPPDSVGNVPPSDLSDLKPPDLVGDFPPSDLGDLKPPDLVGDFPPSDLGDLKPPDSVGNVPPSDSGDSVPPDSDGMRPFVPSIVNMQLNKTVYAPGMEMIVTLSGVTAQMAADQAWVAIFKTGAQHLDYGAWKNVEESTNEVAFSAPSKDGSYEIRLYKAYSAEAKNFVTSAPFNVESGGTAQSLSE